VALLSTFQPPTAPRFTTAVEPVGGSGYVCRAAAAAELATWPAVAPDAPFCIAAAVAKPKVTAAVTNNRPRCATRKGMRALPEVGTEQSPEMKAKQLL
jgi:hypothetical protein